MTCKYVHLDVYGSVPVHNLHQLYYEVEEGRYLKVHQTKSVPSLGGWVYDSAYCLANYLQSESFLSKRKEMKRDSVRDEEWLVELGAGVGFVGMAYNYHKNNNNKKNYNNNNNNDDNNNTTNHNTNENLYTKNNNYCNKNAKNNTNQYNDVSTNNKNNNINNTINNKNNNKKCYCILTELEPLVPLIQFNIEENKKLLTNNINNNNNSKQNNKNNNNNNVNNDNNDWDAKDNDEYDIDDNGINNGNNKHNDDNKQNDDNKNNSNNNNNKNNSNHNNNEISVYAMPLCWGDEDMIRGVVDLMHKRRQDQSEYFDIIIIANCIYYESSLEALLDTLIALSDKNTIVLASYETKTSAIENLIERWHVMVRVHFEVEEVEREVVRKETKDPKYYKDFVRIFVMKRK